MKDFFKSVQYLGRSCPGRTKKKLDLSRASFVWIPRYANQGWNSNSGAPNGDLNAGHGAVGVNAAWKNSWEQETPQQVHDPLAMPAEWKECTSR